MKVEFIKVVKVDELAYLIPFKSGATFSQLWHIFYYTRLFKYVSKKHFVQIKKSFNKICTKKNLLDLCELGYFKSPKKNIYCATNKVLPILKEAGFDTEILPNEVKGIGDINELNNTDVFIQAIKREHYLALLYPNFKYLIPDALLVEFDEVNSRYKLTFLEIEAKKPKWNEYLEEKRNNYLRLAKSIDFYQYWIETAPKIGLTKPNIENFKFSVLFICSTQMNFGTGFNFKKLILNETN